MLSSFENYFATLAQHSSDFICSIAPDLAMRYASPSCESILGWKPEELVDGPPLFLLHPDDVPLVRAAHSQTQQTSGHQGAPVCARVRRKDGIYAWMDITASVMRHPKTGEIDEIVLVMRDVTVRKLLEEKLASLAITDGLTGLLNRRGFDEHLENTWNRTARAGSQMSLLLLDIDHFKSFNDTYGHQVGDDCLRTVCAAISVNLPRKTDVAARYGGEEIAVILPETDSEGAVDVAERLRSAVQALRLPHVNCIEGRGYVSASIGIATALARVGGSMKMPESLLITADSALYKAKRNGRNRAELMLLVAAHGS